MYTETDEISKAAVAELRGMLEGLRWETHGEPGDEWTSHQAAAFTEQLQQVDEITDRWPIATWKAATVMRLRPGCKLYAHADEGWGVTIPVETNEAAVSFSYERSRPPYGIRSEHRLEVGKAYLADRSMRHEAFNDGATNRTYLVLMLKEEPQ